MPIRLDGQEEGRSHTEQVSATKRAGRLTALRELFVFGLVGGSGVIVNMLVGIVMNKLNGGTINARDVLLPIVGTEWNIRFTHIVWIVAFVVANVWNFQLNRSVTFRGPTKAGWWKEFWPFFAVGSVAMLVGLLLKALMTNPTTPLYLPEPYFNEEKGLSSREYWSQLIAIFLTMPVNFIVNKLWTFGTVRASGAAEVEDIIEELKGA